MNKAQKLFWVVIGYILLNIFVGIINFDIGMIMFLIISVGIIISLLIFVLYMVYEILGEE